MEKRGAGHIEIVISYLLFIGFLVFIFYFFNPIKTSKLTDNSLPLAFEEVGRNLTIELRTYSVKIDDPDQEVRITLEEELVGKEIRVVNYSNINQQLVTPEISDRTLSFDPMGEKFVLIIVSQQPEVSDDALPSGDGRESAPPIFRGAGGQGVEISYVGTREVYSEISARVLAERYNSDYLGIKNDFNLQNNDFAFDLILEEDRRVTGERFIPVGIEVYSDYKRKEVIREDGTFAFAELRVRVW